MSLSDAQKLVLVFEVSLRCCMKSSTVIILEKRLTHFFEKVIFFKGVLFKRRKFDLSGLRIIVNDSVG